MIWVLVDDRKVTFEMCLQPIRCWGFNWHQEEAEYWGNNDAFMQKKCNELIYPTFRTSSDINGEKNLSFYFLHASKVVTNDFFLAVWLLWWRERRRAFIFWVSGWWDRGKPSFTSVCVFSVLYELWLCLLIHSAAFYINGDAIGTEIIFLVDVLMRFNILFDNHKLQMWSTMLLTNKNFLF